MLQHSTFHKNNYHPLVSYFCRYQLLSTEQEKTMPRAKGKVFQNSIDLNKSLHDFMDWINNKRYPGSLFGLLPSEVLAGLLPNKHKFAEEIKASKLARPEANKKATICSFCN
jgi:hypothetical protein